jgi:RecA-family ATPase
MTNLNLEACYKGLYEQQELMEAASKPDKGIFDDLQDLSELGWLTDKPKSREYVFTYERPDGSRAGFLPAGKVCMIVSPGGCGKTFLLTHCALAAATGTNWLHTTATKPIKVLFIAAEEDKDELWIRFHNMAKGLGFYMDENRMKMALKNILPVADRGISMRLIDEKHGPTKTFLELKSLIERDEDIKLVILDPASQFMGSETETNNAAATDFIRLIGSLNLIGGKPTVLMAHHTNKTALSPTPNEKVPSFSQSFSRGSSALVDGARWLMGIQRSEARGAERSIFIKVLKSNYTELGGILEFQQDYSNSGTLRYIGEVTASIKQKDTKNTWTDEEDEEDSRRTTSFNHRQRERNE